MTVIDTTDSLFTELQDKLTAEAKAIEACLSKADTKNDEYRILGKLLEDHNNLQLMPLLQLTSTPATKEGLENVASVIDWYLAVTEKHFQNLVKRNTIPDEVSKLGLARQGLKELVIRAKNSEIVIQPWVCSLENPNPTSLTFSTEMGQNPPSQSFTIGIAGTCDHLQITAKVTSGSSWLTVSPPQAPINAGPDQIFTVTVTSTSSSLVAGNYTGSISINALDSNKRNITDCPQTVNVALNVIAPPVLSVTPTSLPDINIVTGGETSSQPITISNIGGGLMSWTASPDSNAPHFVTLSENTGTNLIAGTKLTGTLTAGSSTIINVNVNATGESGGKTYPTGVTISAADITLGSGTNSTLGSKDVPVTINVAENLFLCLMNQIYTIGKGLVFVKQTEKLFKREQLKLSDGQIRQLAKSWDKVAAFVTDPSAYANNPSTCSCLSTAEADLITLQDLQEQLYDRLESNVTRVDEDIFGLE